MSDTYQPTATRPGVVTFIGVILYIQAFLAAVAFLSALIWRDNIEDYFANQGSPLSDGALTGSLIGEAIMAVLLALVASGIMAGSKGMRLLVAIVQCFSMGVAVYVLITHHTGGYVYHSIFSLFIGVFVLWALYAHDASERYFESH